MFAHKCPHCGKMTVFFDEEIPYAEYGLEGKGTVTIYHCESPSCGAVVTVMVPENEEKTEESENGY